MATSLSLVSASNALSLTFNSQFGTGGTGDGQFSGVQGIASDSSGNIFVVDLAGGRVQKFNSSGVYQSQFGSPGSGDGQLNTPYGVAVNSLGNIFVTDGFGRVQKFASNGTSLSSATGYGIAIDSSDNIFTSGLGSIFKYNSGGTLLFSFGSFGSGDGQVQQPLGIAFDASGNIFLADTYNQRVQKFNSSGVYQSQFGSRGYGDGQFYNPQGIALDASGNIFVADSGNSRIQAFDSSGNYLTQIGSRSDPDPLNQPIGLTIVNNKLYATDDYNSRVRVYDINATPVPFDFSPNFGIGILGAVFVTKKLIKKKVVKEKGNCSTQNK